MKATILVVILMLIAVVGCGGDTRQSSLAEYREASSADAVMFHPYLTTDMASSSYQGLVYASGLMDRDPQTLKFKPNMAESWQVSEDGLTYVFKLRNNMMWSDGQPLTAVDFAWTYEQIIKPENEYPYAGILEFIESYLATGSLEITVKIKEPFCPALEGVDAVTPLPKHVWEKLDWKNNPEITHPTVVSGPFRLIEWEREVHAIFEANDLYWKGRPKLDRYVIRIIPEQSIAYTMLENGEVDQASLLPDQYGDVKKNRNLNVYEYWLARGSWQYIGFNLRKPHFQDVRVRQAISYAIEKQKIVDVVMKGLARRQPSTLVPSSPFYTDKVQFYHDDRTKARRLMIEAGYNNGQSEGLKDFPAITIVYGPQSNKIRERIAVIMQANLQLIGIRSEIQAFEWGSYLELLRKPPFAWDLSIAGWAATIDPYWMREVWSLKFAPDLNHGAYDNAMVEYLFEEAGHDCDRQMEIYAEIQRILADDAPYVFLFQNLSWTAINKRIGGIKPSPLGLGYNIHEWHVKR